MTDVTGSALAELRLFRLMTPYGIARYVGSWVSASGYRLRIKKVRKDQASVEFFDPRGAPLQRHYMGGAASVKMIAHYDD